MVATVDREDYRELFAEADSAIVRIQQENARTDLEFLDAEGNFNPDKKRFSNEERQQAREAFAESVSQGLGAIASLGSKVTDFERTVIFGTYAKGFGVDRYYTYRQLPYIGVSTVAEAIRPQLDKLAEQLDWWENEAPFFAEISEFGVKLAPSRGADNTQVVGEYQTDRHNHHPHIEATFTNVTSVGYHAKPNGRSYTDQLTTTDEEDMHIIIYGRTKLMGDSYNLGEQGGPDQDEYVFVGNGEDLSSLSDQQRFLLRAALQLTPDGEECVDRVPTPEEKFVDETRSKIVNALVRRFTMAFNLPDVDHSVTLGVTRIDNKVDTLSGVTFRQLRAYMVAANINATNLKEAVTAKINDLRAADTIEGYVKYQHAKLFADEFFEDNFN